MGATGRSFFPLIILFLFVSILICVLLSPLKSFHIDPMVLHGANVLFFVSSIISISLQRRAISNKNPNVFIRSVMGGMMFKMAACLIAVLVYVILSGSNYNKRGVFAGLFLYLIYLATEVYTGIKMNKQNKSNA